VRVIAPVPALDDGEVTSPCSVHKWSLFDPIFAPHSNKNINILGECKCKILDDRI
jgi:hypothetical protein